MEQSNQDQFAHYGPSPETKQQMAAQKAAREDARLQHVEEPTTEDLQLQAFRRAQGQIPNNRLGLPVNLLRIDMIPPDLDPLHYDKQSYHRILDNASIDINYNEGFPAFNNAIPIWGPIEGYEPSHAFELFKNYLDQSEQYGIRQVQALFINRPSNADVDEERKQAFHYYIVYSWSIRAKAFDLYQQAADKKLREKRIINTTNSHFLQAEKILGTLEECLYARGEEGELIAFADLNAKDIIASMEKLVNIQRKSIGLDSAVKAMDTLPPGASAETLMRIRTEESQDPAARKESSRTQIEALLTSDNIELAMQAQKLITELNRNPEAEKTVQQAELIPVDIAKEIAG